MNEWLHSTSTGKGQETAPRQLLVLHPRLKAVARRVPQNKGVMWDTAPVTVDEAPEAAQCRGA